MEAGERIELACAARRDYLPHAATMLASASANAGSALRAHLLIGDDITDAELSRVAAMLAEQEHELVPHRLEARWFAGLDTHSALPPAHWYRTYLPELLDLSRIIYLDADLLVLDQLTELWQLDLDGHRLAATTNVFPDPVTGAAYCHSLGVEMHRYFNSGVMLLDLEALRAADSFAEVRSFNLSRSERLLLPEQDAMNAIHAGHRLQLGPRWNLLTGITRLAHGRALFDAADVERALARPAVRHFEGSANKPWQRQAAAPDRDLWRRYSDQTPWGSQAGDQMLR